eukprot:CAMPEP_0168719854 /NCGR_PEP_ID=MMETSP0724-20121128/1257_1 /TAXON_ID=265536 /ORGANISM="Amphiprora sp., Strain CCMP467" /LENGTH=317 /DNA_ID=CAMNT_0008766429 /DNA_START=223 /DNA_END=1176 /DNA_ORIENTATION=+
MEIINWNSSNSIKGANEVCAPVWIDGQSELVELYNTTLSSQRVKRLALLRDAQRRRIQQLFFTNASFVPWYLGDDASVIQVDLDMEGFPMDVAIMDRVKSQASQFFSDENSPHIICAAGNNFAASQRGHRMAYYDLFATILYPNTFAVSIKNRLVREVLPDEDTNRIPKDIRGKKRSTSDIYSLMEFLKNASLSEEDRLVPVRSCFGGLAIYKAKTWLTPLCNYTIPSSVAWKYRYLLEEIQRRHKISSLSDQEKERFLKSIFRYSAFGESPCEHVVFHECLHRVVFDTLSDDGGTLKAPFSRSIVVDAHLHTHWSG